MEAIGTYGEVFSALSPLPEAKTALPAPGGEGGESDAPKQGDTANFSPQALAASTMQRSAEALSSTPAAPVTVTEKEFGGPALQANDDLRVATREPDGSAGAGDTASFSRDALDELAGQIASVDKMSASDVLVSLDDGQDRPTLIGYNNKNGAITWNGNRLDIAGFANVLKDDVAIRNVDGHIEVSNLTTGQKLTLNGDGTRQRVDGKPDPAAVVEETRPASELSTGLFINNRGLASATGGGNDVIINRQAGAYIDAGAGNDKIFNFASTASSLSGGGGNDCVYSVGLIAGTDIDVSDGNGYVRLLGNMTGGSIALGSGQNLVDATGRTLSGVTITDADGAEASAVVAKVISGRSDVTLNAAQTAIDVYQLSSVNIALGTGANSLVADKISGKATDAVVITGKGVNSYRLGSVAYAHIDNSASISDAILIRGATSYSTFDLGKGNNLLDAGKNALTAVSITSASGGAGATTVRAGSLVGKNLDAGRASIDLAASAAGNTVEIAGAVKNAFIDTGAGAGTVKARSMANVTLTMGGAGSTATQHVQVEGKASKLEYAGGDGEDNLRFFGAVSNSIFDLGAGSNSFNVSNANGTALGVSNTDIMASGAGATSLSMGHYAYGANGNAIELGSGANTISMGKVSGKGKNGLAIDLSTSAQTQTVRIAGPAAYLRYAGSSGADNITVAGSLSHSEIDLGSGDNSLSTLHANGALQAVSNTNIMASGAGSTTLRLGKFTYGAGGNTIELGGGANTVEMGTVGGKGTLGLNIEVAGTAASSTTLDVRGKANRLFYTGSAGTDSITVAGALTNSDIDLGDGANSLSTKNAKGVYQGVSNTNISASGNSSTTLALGNVTYGASGNIIELGGGTNTVEAGSIGGKGTLGLNIEVSGAAATSTTVNIRGKAGYLSYTGSAGADSITVGGALANAEIDLGDGVNSLSAKNAKGVYQGVSNTNISASGNSSTTLAMGKYTYGALGNSISLGGGSNEINAGVIGGKGTMGLSIDVTGTDQTETALNLRGASAYLSYSGSAGADRISTTGSMRNSDINLGGGENAFSAEAAKTAVTDTSISASGSGANSISIAQFSAGKKGESFLLLGDGDDTVSIGTLTGNTSVNMGGGAANDFSVKTMTGGALASAGGGVFSVDKGSKLTFDFSGGSADVTLNIHSALTSALIDLGGGNTHIGDEGTETSRAALSGVAINAGAGALTMDVHSLAGSSVDMTTEAAGETARLNMTVRNNMNSSTVTLGHGDNTMSVESMHGSTVNRAEAGSLLLQGKDVISSALNLTGAGADTVDLSGDLRATMVFGEGADSIKVGGAVGGSIRTESDLTLESKSIASLTGDFGANSTLTVAKSITGSTLNGGTGSMSISQADVQAEGEEDGQAQGLLISGSRISSDGELYIRAQDVASSHITITNGDDDKGDLDFELTGDLRDSSLRLGGGDLTVKTATMKNAEIIREDAGSLLLKTGSMNGGRISLTGEGSDTLNVSGDLSARITLGAGADTINVGGVLSGGLANTDAVSITADALKGMDMTLTGGGNVLSVATAVSDSTLRLGLGDAVIGSADMIYTNTVIEGGDSNYTILGSRYEGGSISLGEGDNNIGVTGLLSGKVTLGSGGNSVGSATTVYEAFVFSGSGNNTITGQSLTGSSVAMGAAGGVNKLLISEGIKTSTVTLNGGDNTVGSATASLRDTVISGSGAGSNAIEAASMSGGSITLMESDDHVDIRGAIENASISLGEGVNTLRNTLGAGEAASTTGPGGALDNRVINTTIVTGDSTNIYLGSATDGTTISGAGTNNINVASMFDGAIDASAMRGTHIGVGTAVSSAITAGVGGAINVGHLESGGITDDLGSNAINIGLLDQRATLETGELIHSTAIHVNTMDGTMNLANDNYDGLKRDHLSIANNPYAGRVNIAGESVAGAGTAAAEKDVSGYGRDAGAPIVRES